MGSDKRRNWWAGRRPPEEAAEPRPGDALETRSAKQAKQYWAKRGVSERPLDAPPVDPVEDRSTRQAKQYWAKRGVSERPLDAPPIDPVDDRSTKRAKAYWAKRSPERPLDAPPVEAVEDRSTKRAKQWWAQRSSSELPVDPQAVDVVEERSARKARQWWAQRSVGELALHAVPDEVVERRVSALEAWGRRHAIGPWPIVVTVVLALLLIGFAGYFATVQNVWIDESTQLLGSSVSFTRMIAWLVGGFEPFGVPGDRMPPLSYVLDWSCAETLCSRPLYFRFLHLAVTAVGLMLVSWQAGRRHGPIAGLVAGLLLVLLPQTVMYAVEIRAYPIFFTLTALQLVMLYRLIDRPLDWRGLLSFSALGLVSVYTHFFGLVATSALFCGLIVAKVRTKRQLWMVIAAWALLLVLSVGLWPFIDGAQMVSTAIEQVPVTVGTVASYLAHILGSAPMLVVRPPAVAFFVCMGLLIVVLVVSLAIDIWRTPLDRPLAPEVAIVVAIAAGIVASIVSSLFLKGFNPMKPSYSIWLLPPIALLAGAAAARGWFAAIVAGLMLVALVPVQAMLLRHADLFIHGPEREIDVAIDHDPRGTAIIYFGNFWPYPYYPLIYRHGDKLAHYFVGPDSQLRPLGYGGDINLLPVGPHDLDGYRRLVIVAVSAQTGGDLRMWFQHRSPDNLVQPIPLGGIPLDRRIWQPTLQIVRPGLYWLRLTRFERK